MTSRVTRARKPARPINAARVGPRDLFGESLPELLLLTAVLAAVIGGALTLHG